MTRARAAGAIFLAVSALLLVGCSLVVDPEGTNRGCPDGEKECDGECVRADVEHGCGGPQCSPCALDHASARCSSGEDGRCIVAACIGTWEDCDRDSTNGCEVNIDNDVEHCGSCDEACPMPENGSGACGAARCYVRKCDEDHEDCDGEFANGCEVDVRRDPNHCGECGVVCDGACEAGSCAP